MPGERDQEILSLSELRRGAGRGMRRARAPEAELGPGLFDSLPVEELRDQGLAVADPIKSSSRDPGPSIAIEDVRESQVTPQVISQPQVWSVGELVRQVRGLVERNYSQVWVEGEISNWRPSASGHCYFTLKDSSAQLSVVMFRKQALLLRFRPNDGDAVRVSGQLSVYEARGQMQMVVEWMEQVGLGAMLAAVRELKERLRREGLFERKRELPEFPRCIGIVTSLQGAALRDIVKVCRRRHAAVKLLIYPAAVQGPRCAVEVAAGVRWFDRHPAQVDVVLVARGGGSWEDLHGFDDERVARAIGACSVPVISGIGHATDSTIADAAADVCAPTPSAAAELLTAAQHRVEERVERLGARLARAMRYEALQARQRLAGLSAELTPRRIAEALRQREQRMDEAGFRLEAATDKVLRARGERLARLDGRLRRQSIEMRMAENRRRLGVLEFRLRSGLAAAMRRREARVDGMGARLEALSPLRVLERGYALVYGPDGRLLRSAGEVETGEAIVARLAEGRLRAVVEGKN